MTTDGDSRATIARAADQIVWLYAPTSSWVRSTASTALNMSRMRASDTGLSTTTTSSGLLEEARARPQVPSSTVTRTPLTVTRSRILLLDAYYDRGSLNPSLGFKAADIKRAWLCPRSGAVRCVESPPR
jgi:hypothetical protein